MKRMADVPGVAPGVARGSICTHIMKYNALKMYNVDLNNVNKNDRIGSKLANALHL
jgi:hypothetical protein